MRKRKKADISSSRYKAEMAGTIINGIQVHTDERTRGALTAGLMAVVHDPSFVFTNWKMPDGTFMDANGEIMSMFLGGIITYVGALFDKEKELNVLIDDAETIEDIESIVW
jgi:hypothetical protein